MDIGDIIIAKPNSVYDYTSVNKMFKIIDIDNHNRNIHVARPDRPHPFLYNDMIFFTETSFEFTTRDIKVIPLGYIKIGWFVPSFWVDSYYFEK